MLTPAIFNFENACSLHIRYAEIYVKDQAFRELVAASNYSVGTAELLSSL